MCSAAQKHSLTKFAVSRKQEEWTALLEFGSSSDNLFHKVFLLHEGASIETNGGGRNPSIMLSFFK